MAKRDPRLRAFVKVDKLGQVVPGTLVLRYKAPEGGTGYFWQEIIADVCCATPVSNFEFTENSGGAGLLLITVNGVDVVNTDHTLAGKFGPISGDSVAISLTGAGPTKTLLVVDDTSGVVLSNQTGTTGALTYNYVAPTGHTYTVLAMAGPTTTTTTTTTTSTTTTTTTTP